MSPSRRSTRRSLLAAVGAAATVARGVTPAARARVETPPTVRAIYLNPLATTDDEFFGLVDLIDRTELNAMVVDVKEDGVYLPTAVELFLEAGEVNPAVLDVDGLLRTLADRGIYAIARVVTFRDTYLAEAQPDLAVRDAMTGGPWYSYDGLGWLNPLAPELRDAYTAFAIELADRGFDEVQFDYVRFPSDGDLSRMDFGRPVDEAVRVDAIVGFLDSCRRAIAPAGAKTAADIFGYTLLIDDIGIGQNAGRIAEVVDYVCPMVYPSHFPAGSLALPGHPNDYPSETIQISMEAGSARVPPAQLRPWLQDFSLAGMSPYGAAEVRAQIDAAEAAGTNGWMLWAADSVYTARALRPAG